MCSNIPAVTAYGVSISHWDDTIFQSWWFLSWFPWKRVVPFVVRFTMPSFLHSWLRVCNKSNTAVSAIVLSVLLAIVLSVLLVIVLSVLPAIVLSVLLAIVLSVLLAIVLSVLLAILWFTDSDYFCIFKLFLKLILACIYSFFILYNKLWFDSKGIKSDHMRAASVITVYFQT
jgi:hypothetical protein